MPSAKQSATGADSNVVNVDDEGWETLVEEFGETWAPRDIGDELIGVYQGSKLVEQTDFGTGEIREVPAYEVTDTAGKKWTVWSSHNIDIGFSSCGTGDTVRIIYMGTENLDGGRTVKKYRFYRKNR